MNERVPSPSSPSSTSGDSLSTAEDDSQQPQPLPHMRLAGSTSFGNIAAAAARTGGNQAASLPTTTAVSTGQARTSTSTSVDAMSGGILNHTAVPLQTRRKHGHHHLSGLGTGSAKMGSSITDSAQSTEDEMYPNDRDHDLLDDVDDDAPPQVFYPALATPTAGPSRVFWPFGVAANAVSSAAIIHDNVHPRSDSTGGMLRSDAIYEDTAAESEVGDDDDLADQSQMSDAAGAKTPSLARSRSRRAASLSRHARHSIVHSPDMDDDSTISGSQIFAMDKSQWYVGQTGGKPSAAYLPHEILLKILRNIRTTPDLVSALLVCKSWCQCGVELLWNKPLFPNIAQLIKMLVILSWPVKTFPYAAFIKRLNFSQLADRMSDLLLTRLTVCERLERLTLAGCSEITDDSLELVLKSCKGLVALDMSECAKVTDATVRIAATYCRRLQGLNLSGCKLVTDAGLQEIARGCPMLRRVKLRGLETLTDTAIIALAQSCPLLLEVDLYSCTSVTDRILWALFRSSSHLRELSLNNCSQIGGDAFPQKEGALIYLKGANDRDIVNKKPLNPKLHHLSYPAAVLNRAGRIDEILPHLRDASPLASRLYEHVRYLDMTGLTNLTDIAIEGIVSTMPHIRNLVLAKCSNLSDDSVNSICKLGKHIHFLHLGHVSNITDKAVTTLARACTRLRYIDLACCPNLTDLSVFELAANLPRLKRIGLVRVANLTDQAIFALAERTTLERIHLSYCENVSVTAVQFLLGHLRRLNHLSLTGVPQFRRPDLQHFCRPPPKEFNSHQRSTFCVYSGKGVQELRKHLESMQRGSEAGAGGQSRVPVYERFQIGPGGQTHIPFAQLMNHQMYANPAAAASAMANAEALRAPGTSDDEALDDGDDDDDADDDGQADDDDDRYRRRMPNNNLRPAGPSIPSNAPAQYRSDRLQPHASTSAHPSTGHVHSRASASTWANATPSAIGASGGRTWLPRQDAGNAMPALGAPDWASWLQRNMNMHELGRSSHARDSMPPSLASVGLPPTISQLRHIAHRGATASLHPAFADAPEVWPRAEAVSYLDAAPSPTFVHINGRPPFYHAQTTTNGNVGETGAEELGIPAATYSGDVHMRSSSVEPPQSSDQRSEVAARRERGNTIKQSAFRHEAD